MLKCHIVQDLLPSYLKHLTSSESSKDIEEHLASCEECRKVKAAMETDSEGEKGSKPKLNFIRKLKRKQIVGVILSLIAAISCLAWIYGSEYHINLKNTAMVKECIQNDISSDPRYENTEIRLVESINKENQVLILYRLDDEDGYRGKGVACFSRGLFGRYRIRSIGATTWALDSYAPIHIGFQDYLLVGNVNQPIGAETLRIYANYHDPFYEGDVISELLTTTQPIYEGNATDQSLFLIPLTKEQAKQSYWGEDAVYYDKDGKMLDSIEIARQYYGMENTISGTLLGAEHSLQTLCFWMILTLALGVIFVRYFLTA